MRDEQKAIYYLEKSFLSLGIFSLNYDVIIVNAMAQVQVTFLRIGGEYIAAMDRFMDTHRQRCRSSNFDWPILCVFSLIPIHQATSPAYCDFPTTPVNSPLFEIFASNRHRFDMNHAHFIVSQRPVYFQINFTLIPKRKWHSERAFAF